MANPEHLAILKQGVEEWNKWRKEYADVTPDLVRADLEAANLRGAFLSRGNLGGANLGDADLRGADFYRANVARADLRRAYLSGAHIRRADLSDASLFLANLGGANLTGANLTGANLSGANLSEADLGGADLTGAILYRATLNGANLGGADFAGAQAYATNFTSINLSVAKGLEAIKHDGPSTVGIDTIYKSNGKIPKVFLRGCGVPDEFIAYIGSMVGRAIEFYSCFISYSSKDQEFAERLHADLQAKGVRPPQQAQKRRSLGTAENAGLRRRT